MARQYWDLLGDIHGHYAGLVRLLERLGYAEEGGRFLHPEGRKVIFTGDLINKGPQSREVLRLARRMMEQGNAHAVLGNHEFDFVSSRTGGVPDRKRVDSVETLRSYCGDVAELDEMVEWIKGLPFFLELDGLRVVHAAWIEGDIAFLRGKALRDDAFLIEANRSGSRVAAVVDRVLKGVEVSLPPGVTIPGPGGVRRNFLRVKWWNAVEGKTWGEIAFPERGELSGCGAFPAGICDFLSGYPAAAVPVFFGHYNLEGCAPFAAASNVACLDYGLAQGVKATAYRWSGEATIEVENFVQVDSPAADGPPPVAG